MTQTEPDGISTWKRQLAVVWCAQFLAVAAFCFGIPFAAYFIQELGVTDQDDVLFWTAVFQGAAPVAFSFAAPIWGSLADRFGRKPMLIRANCCAALVLWGMGAAPDVWWLIAARVGQGLFTGTVPAAQTLVAVSTPAQRHGLALGALSAALFAGACFGFALGGWTAEQFGYRTSFVIGGGLALLSAGIIAVGTREEFVKPAKRARRVKRETGEVSLWRQTMPLLVLIAGTATVIHTELPILPLLVQELNGGLQGSAAIMGNMGAIGALAAMIAGTVWGSLADRFAPTRIAGLCAVLAAAACIPFALAEHCGLPLLYGAKFALAFMIAGLDPVFQVWLSRITPGTRRGAMFGLASTARSIGWMVGPLGASGLAAWSSLTVPYWSMAVGFLLLIPLSLWAAARLRAQAARAATALPSEPA